MAANSAIWLADSMADVIGYPLATLFVTFLGGALAVAFWLDAVTYLASAALIVTMIIPAVTRLTAEAVPGLRGLGADMMAGWRFLRGEPVLLANTIQAVVGQFSIGVTIGLMAVYAQDVLVSDVLRRPRPATGSSRRRSGSATSSAASSSAWSARGSPRGRW